MTKFEQKIIGKDAKGTQIGELGNYYDGESISIGLSVEEVKEIFQIYKQMKKEDRQELDKHLQQIKEAKTDEEKKSLARKTAEFIKNRGLGIFDSLVAGGILMLSRGSQ